MKHAVSPAKVYAAALSYLAMKQVSRAEALLRQLLDQFPDKMEYCEAMLECLCQQEKTEEVLDLFGATVKRFNPTNDPDYDATYIAAVRTTESSPLPLRRMLRFYEMVKQLQRTLPLSGEVVECGCFRGLSSYLMCSYLKRHNPSFAGNGYHIFDSFQGLSTPTLEDEIPADHPNALHLEAMTQAGAFSATLKQVQHNLKNFPAIEFHAGWIPLTFSSLPERNYKFVHIDVDLYDPTWSCLEYFYPRLVEHGALVSDDYVWPGARKAIEEFCAERKIVFDVTTYQQAVIAKI